MYLWITIDIGETTGWAIWDGDTLLASGQTPLWEFIDAIDEWLNSPFAPGPVSLPEVFGPGLPVARLRAMIVEDFVVYANKAQALIGDKLRTVRGIGALELLARQHNLPIYLQGAAIKDAAEAAGAAEQFNRPLYENRHANDAIMHGVFWLAMHKNEAPG